MFWLIIIGLLLFFGILFSMRYHALEKKRYYNKKNDEFTYKTGSLWFSIASGIAFFIVICSTFSEISYQKWGYDQLRCLHKKETIYKNKATALTTQFASYLATAYPKHEKNIFKTITPDRIDVYLAKYPELRSADTVMALVTEISKLQTDYYNQQLAQENILRNIHFNTKDPWLFYWWIPTLSELEAQYGKLPE